MKRKMILTVLLGIFLAGAGIAAYKILDIALEYRTGVKTYETMQQYVRVETIPVQETAEAEAVTEGLAEEAGPGLEPAVYPEVDFASLREVNEDVVGWIYLENTKINYPIVQGENNRYYVSTLIDGRYNSSGSIFMDYRNTPDFSDRHTILYGHNMNNGTMFNAVTMYRNQKYYDEHPMGLIVTPEKKFQFEVVSAYVASLADSAWQLEFVDDRDALQWLEASMERSPFVSRYTPQPGDRMLTLSTCTYEFDDARFVLVGVLREETE